MESQAFVLFVACDFVRARENAKLDSAGVASAAGYRQLDTVDSQSDGLVPGPLQVSVPAPHQSWFCAYALWISMQSLPSSL